MVGACAIERHTQICLKATSNGPLWRSSVPLRHEGPAFSHMAPFPYQPPGGSVSERKQPGRESFVERYLVGRDPWGPCF